MTTQLPRIWIITDPDHGGPVEPIRRALEGCPAGQVGVQLRAKRVSQRQLIAWGRELRAITAAVDSPLVVNQRADVARIIGADGVHVPEHGLPIGELRRVFPELAILGVSRHDRSGLQVARDDRVTYAFLSPVFEVPGKVPPIGVEGFERAIAGIDLPIFALGGIGLGRASPWVSAGAYGVAVRRAIYDTPDPRRALRLLLRELDKTGGTPD